MAAIPWNEIIELLSAWQNYVYCGLGIIVGLTVGALPGLTGGIGIALLLPFSFFLSPLEAVALLIGVYKASLFGGAISAITFGTPGTPSAAMDVLDGYPLTKQGKARKALQMALYASVTGDLGSDLVLLFGVGALATISLAFGSRELLALMVLALTSVIIFSRESPAKGAIAVLIGIFLATIGQDMFTGIPRFTFGTQFLADGIDFLPFLIGILAFSEVLVQALAAIRTRHVAVEQAAADAAAKIKGSEKLTLREYLGCLKAIAIGWFLGTIIGILPGPGATMAAYTSWAAAKQVSKEPEKFGRGSLEGLAAAEAGNSATCGATFIPLFALGIPGSSMAALFAGAFMLHGIHPGPAMLRDHTALIYAILVFIVIANFLHLVIGAVLTPVYTYLAYLPSRILVPFLAVFSVLGVYVYRNSVYDVLVMILLAIVGYWLKAYKFPVTATVIGFILAPLIESNIRRSLMLGRGDYLYIFKSPLANGLFIAALISLLFLGYREFKARRGMGVASSSANH